MVDQPPGPLGETDYVELVRRMKDLDEADLQIQKAVQAGVDVSAQREKSRELRGQLLRLKQSYFPGR
jgi:hypothetical protein